MREVCDDVIVVGRRVDNPSGIRSILDGSPERGPLMGILTGMRVARHSVVAVCGCDYPFLSATAFGGMIERMDEVDAVVPRQDGFPQPIHAVYAVSLIEPIVAYLATGQGSINRFLRTVRVRWIDEDEWETFDPESRSLINVNTPEEWQQIRHGTHHEPSKYLDESSPAR
jgi:molybdopterin-guanine dinucleotide biosynthesis protein A